MKILHNKWITIYILICLLLLIGNVHGIFSSKSNDATNDKPTFINEFYNHLSNLKDHILIKMLGTFESLKQREAFRLRQIQFRSEYLKNFYRQIFGVRKYLNKEKDLTDSEYLESLDKFQSQLPQLPDVTIAELFNSRIYDVDISRRDYIALTGCILWAPLWFWSFSQCTLDYDRSLDLL
ncbi:15487_t:CDS:2 [Dentiscutata heterogama]|uniref:15487_t:CDS:1 n=1 Tax=Dentiscutata heterogama TaxID=1316150 RepID=A0ACA9K074_9GLOM|nr:15487_t:CDS:2 [Dentiscutata heterogama]